ncbi:MAG: hypothetical protein F8N37_20125, partial [Telmatospirillum sp.]|nr:hypothetical protein [Telmatospirillum sp.]
MSTDLLSLFSLFCVLVLPYALWRLGGLASIVPCAVVQICLGIALGPAGLGQVAPGLEALLFPAAVRSRVDGLAAFAILFFALITGLHLDLSHYRGRVREFLLVGLGSVAVPFVLAAGAAAWIWLSFPSVRSPAGGIPFIAATAIALSVTALPVLGAILRELDLTGAPIGNWSLGLAAMNDAALWLLVGLLLAVYGHAGTTLGEQFFRVSAGAVYLAAMFGFVQPALGRFLLGREIAADTLLVLV